MTNYRSEFIKNNMKEKIIMIYVEPSNSNSKP